MSTDDDDDVLVQQEYTVTHHEEDTDDIAIEFNPDQEDRHHSKHWNMVVNQKALELEHQMTIEENQEVAKEKAVQQAKERKARAEIEAAEMKRRQIEEAKKAKLVKPVAKKSTDNKQPTVDFSELYSGISAME